MLSGLLGLLCGLTLVVLFSALHRLGLYTDAYGQSRLRLSVQAAIWWLGALFAWLVFEPNRHPRAATWDRPWIHDSGWAVDVWARWDSVWLVRIAQDGYGAADTSAAFFPGYPALLALGHPSPF